MLRKQKYIKNKKIIASQDGKKKYPNQKLPDDYTSSEQDENIKTAQIVGGIILGLTALIINAGTLSMLKQISTCRRRYKSINVNRPLPRLLNE